MSSACSCAVNGNHDCVVPLHTEMVKDIFLFVKIKEKGSGICELEHLLPGRNCAFRPQSSPSPI